MQKLYLTEPNIEHPEWPYVAYVFNDTLKGQAGKGYFYLRYKGDTWKWYNEVTEKTVTCHYGVTKPTCIKMLKSIAKHRVWGVMHIWLHFKGTSLNVQDIMAWVSENLDPDYFTIVE